VDAVLNEDPPFAAEPSLRSNQLRGSMLWAPGPLNRLDFLHRLADRFGIRNTATSVDLGLAHFLSEVMEKPRRLR
jgi:hypothetical protein